MKDNRPCEKEIIAVRKNRWKDGFGKVKMRYEYQFMITGGDWILEDEIFTTKDELRDSLFK